MFYTPKLFDFLMILQIVHVVILNSQLKKFHTFNSSTYKDPKIGSLKRKDIIAKVFLVNCIFSVAVSPIAGFILIVAEIIFVKAAQHRYCK